MHVIIWWVVNRVSFFPAFARACPLSRWVAAWGWLRADDETAREFESSRGIQKNIWHQILLTIGVDVSVTHPHSVAGWGSKSQSWSVCFRSFRRSRATRDARRTARLCIYVCHQEHSSCAGGCTQLYESLEGWYEEEFATDTHTFHSGCGRDVCVLVARHAARWCAGWDGKCRVGSGQEEK